jgi:competence protein ComEA
LRVAATAALLAGLCAFGLVRRAGASSLPGRLPPTCSVRVQVHGPEGFDQLACAAEVAAALRAAGRPEACPALAAQRDGARVTLTEAGSCATTVGRMAGPALRLLRLPIDINLASVEDLQALPGIGPGLALRLVAARPFRKISELQEVAGIGPKRLAALARAAEVTSTSR